MFQEKIQPIGSAVEVARAKITPVILAGGHGTRLWPLSTKEHPKQFSVIQRNASLYQNTLDRLKTNNFRAPLVVGNLTHLDILQSQSKGRDISLILEPSRKNTAASVLVAALCIVEETPDEFMLICPADHDFSNDQILRDAISEAVIQIQDHSVVTFGINPSFPSTDYGYITPDNRFVEKPTKRLALKIIEDGGKWNSGIFLAKASTIINLFTELQPDLSKVVQATWRSRKTAQVGDTLEPNDWDLVPDISFDHAIMNYCKNVQCFSLDAGWSDLGDWQHLEKIIPEQDTKLIECENSTLRSTHGPQQLVGIGLKNITAIATKDAVLICDSNSLDLLKTLNIKSTSSPSQAYRPWGRFESISKGERYQVKKITVDPGEVLSLQSHHHRAEHWIVVQGTAKVTKGEQEFLLSENQSTYISLGEKHRLENPGKIPLQLIEVQTGCYLGEDDIIRYEDRYNRL